MRVGVKQCPGVPRWCAPLLSRYCAPFIKVILMTEIRPKNEFNNVPQRVLARESQ